MRSERRHWPKAAIQFPLTPAFFLSQAEWTRARRGARKNWSPSGRTPSTGWPTPRQDHRLRLPHPRLSPAFSSRLRVRAMGHSVAVPRRSRHASIAGRVFQAVVTRPVAVGVAEVERRAREDEPAAAGTAHLPAGDEGSEPLPQSPVRATVAACLRRSTAAGALELLDMAARARPAQGDDLPVPTNTGGRCHLVVVLPGGGMIVIGGDMRTPWVAPPVAGFGDAERRTSSAAGILTVWRAPPN